MDHRLYRLYARSPRGVKIEQKVHGSRRGRTSVIAVCKNNRLLAPFVFEGTCNTEVVNTYLKQVLLPELIPGTVIILDNARFHQSQSTLKLVEKAGCHLLFLPPYSPDFNPIEHLWAALKSLLRPLLPSCFDPFSLIANMSQCYC